MAYSVEHFDGTIRRGDLALSNFTKRILFFHRFAIFATFFPIYTPAPAGNYALGYYGPQPGEGAVAYCTHRFRRYSPRTGTYLGTVTRAPKLLYIFGGPRPLASVDNRARTHLSLNKDARVPRAVQTVGRIHATPILGGLHHHYVRV